MSMTVEKSTADDVRKKFETLQKDKDRPAPVDSVMDGEVFSSRLLSHYELAPIATYVTAYFALCLVLLYKGAALHSVSLDSSSTICDTRVFCDTSVYLQDGTEKC